MATRSNLPVALNPDRPGGRPHVLPPSYIILHLNEGLRLHRYPQLYPYNKKYTLWR